MLVLFKNERKIYTFREGEYGLISSNSHLSLETVIYMTTLTESSLLFDANIFSLNKKRNCSENLWDDIKVICIYQAFYNVAGKFTLSIISNGDCIP